MTRFQKVQVALSRAVSISRFCYVIVHGHVLWGDDYKRMMDDLRDMNR